MKKQRGHDEPKSPLWRITLFARNLLTEVVPLPKVLTLAFAGICVLVAVLWFVFRRTPVGSRFLARFLWVDTAANFVIIPMTLFGLGRLSTRIFDAFDQPTLAEGSIIATQLALYIAVAIGFG